MKIVIDTNIFIAAIIKPSAVRHLILESPNHLLFPEVILSEINKHESELLKKSGLNKTELEIVRKTLMDYLELIPTRTIEPFLIQALKIIEKIDPNDVSFIAACLANDAILWSDDKDLKKQSDVKVLNTKEILNLFDKN